ncbi:hypothetical protein [Paludisphaera sp.]|uniref:hypothetical protein n=1 Tax=Paludisphaera sp. TaxID=2017432 RepID=UPI00301D8C21
MSTAPESPPATLRDFLHAKADEYGVRDRLRRRKEWLDAIGRLYQRLETWMREADPEGLLDIVPYEVQRTEQGLGTFNVPALLVSFGPEDISIEPMFAGPSRHLLDVAIDRDQSYQAEVKPPYQGRVDISNRFNTFHIYRKVGEPETWHVLDGRIPRELDRDRFESILKELLA